MWSYVTVQSGLVLIRVALECPVGLVQELDWTGNEVADAVAAVVVGIRSLRGGRQCAPGMFGTARRMNDYVGQRLMITYSLVLELDSQI